MDGQAFRPHWRIHTHLAVLAETGKIDRDQLDAALSWLAWCETLGRQRVQSWNTPIDCSLKPGTVTSQQFAAVAQLDAGAAALGRERTALLQWCLVDD
jgi:hypothetical protein